MKNLVNKLKGDKVIWSFVALLALFSFMPVFSASSNLAYLGHGTGNTLGYLLKHLVHICCGFAIIFYVHKIPYQYFRSLSRLLLPLVWVILLITMVKGTVIGGANASRWLQIPFIGLSFQPSAFAALILFIYVARYLSKTRETPIDFVQSCKELWLPVFITLMFILPSNFSTTALIFSMVIMLVFIGKYPLKYIGFIVGSGIVALVFFVLVAKAFPNAFPNRVDTWISRIESFTSDKPDEDDYQIEKAKIAIASGKIYGLGPGKSVQKNFLPQSSSDFIFAIIVEEYGLVGGIGVLIIYMFLLIRFVVASHKAPTMFGKLVVIGLGFPMIFQAMINMAVAVELLPVTGQTLPLISSGGTSIWMTCIALGIILSVTKKEEEIAEEQKEAAKRDEVLQRLIDETIAAENNAEPSYSIEEKGSNPLKAVYNK
ncbi:FtsW/RodA/SpoVE family cell cycle protein [Flavobacterium sp. F-328]|uniref:Probable peptidoglycan glycosyltransferase FtsW n=1 Tax=Flavobacterium erciyesense TaxID=2825842 RepID=A0ABS5CZC2_9FLAO|nr:FtsW/RodA/SpoVE family cell cycle protein [Flavobacterium erciyesense]MBQ0907114.1 FtsW/RodA/SpoVE family cell cycle protein [Flavobacterium erciyesense]